MKILLTGGEGNLSKEIIKANDKFQIIAPTKKEMDIRITSEIEKIIIENQPNIIIHTAAITKPKERHDLAPCDSIMTNIIGTCNLTLISMKHGIKLVYISSDAVYNGRKNIESDPLLPKTNYGWSKLGGECAVQMYNNSLIIRGAFCEIPFPYSNAYSDVKKNLLYQNKAAQIILSVIGEIGVMNIGSDVLESLYDFAKKSNKSVKKIKSNAPEEKYLDTTKMKIALGVIK